MTIRLVRAEFHVGGWTDRQRDITKLIVAFLNFANALKIIKKMFYTKLKIIAPIVSNKSVG